GVSVELGRLVAAGDVPQPDGVVVAGGGQRLAVGREGHGADGAGVADDLDDGVAGGRLYDVDGRDVAGGARAVGGQPAVGREDDAQDVTLAGGRAVQLLAAGRVPQPEVLAAGRDDLTVGRQGHTGDVGGVPLEAADFLPRRHFPQADGAVPAARRQRLAVL